MEGEGMIIEQQSSSNVLFEPAIYAQPNYEEEISEQMQETQSDASTLRCCMCGVMMIPNEANTCINCLKSSIDITEGIPKQLSLNHCRECNRYLRPPWQNAALESPELLSLCLKNIKGLKRVKLIDAGFLYTEPHSRRLKIKLTVQKEVMNGTVLQQSFVVEFIVNNLQCDDCKRTYTPHTWIAQAQVRQRVDHKRTFLFLEQLIIKHNAAEKSIGIKEVHDGLDFQFKNRSHAHRLVDFIQNQIPAKIKTAKQLISQDLKNNTYNYKYTFSVDIAPICKDDLVILPKTLSQQLGGIGPLVLVYKISTFVHIVDVFTMQTYEIDQINYWKHQFTALCGRDRLTEFIVLNIENTDYDVNVSRAAARQKFRMVQVEVARKSDFGRNDKTYIVNTHLGEILNFNDTVLAFDLDIMNINALEELEAKHPVPPVVIVKKTFPKFRKSQKYRLWQLKHLEKEGIDDNNFHKKKENNQNKNKKDYDMFIQDIEDEPEMRDQFDLFRNESVIQQLEAKLAGMNLEEEKQSSAKQPQKEAKGKDNKGKERKVTTAVRKTNEGKKKQVETEESKKKQQQLIKASMKDKQDGNGNGDSDWESAEEDYPHIQLDQLKSLEDQLAGMKIQGAEDDDDDYLSGEEEQKKQ